MTVTRQGGASTRAAAVASWGIGRENLLSRSGVITAIADRRGLDVPLSRRIVALIRQAEADGAGSPGLTPEQIRP
jgi:hypothetical protein